MKFVFVALLLSLLASCAGYQLGGKKPSNLAEVDSIYVPLAKNRTLFPRAEALATNSMVDQLTQDGTYRIGTADASDATLLLTISEIRYSQVRSSELDTLRSDELEMRLTLKWKLIDPSTPQNPLAEGSSKGHTRFFARGNLQTARAGALPDALQRATQHIVSRIADGF